MNLSLFTERIINAVAGREMNPCSEDTKALLEPLGKKLKKETGIKCFLNGSEHQLGVLLIEARINLKLGSVI